MKFNQELFTRLYNLDISNLVEQTYNKLNYLSWAMAYKLLLEHDPEAKYEVLKAPDGMPYWSRGQVNFVYTKVKAFETEIEMYLPVMDNKYKPVAEPNSTQVNNTIQRCLAKNIAMFGIGLKLYVGEDLEQFKEDMPKQTATEEDYKKFIKLYNEKEFDTKAFMGWLQKTYGVNNIGSVANLERVKVLEIIGILSKYHDKNTTQN